MITAPTRTSADVLAQYKPVLEQLGAWRYDTSDPAQLKIRYLDNRLGQSTNAYLRDVIAGVALVHQTKSGKPIEPYNNHWVNESMSFPARAEAFPGVLGSSVGMGDHSIPSTTWTTDQAAADALIAVLDLDRKLDGVRAWQIKPLASRKD